MESTERWARVVAGKEVGILWLLFVGWYAIGFVIPEGSVLYGVFAQPIGWFAAPSILIGYSWMAVIAWFYLLAIAFAGIARWSGVFELEAWRSVLNKETQP